MSLTQYNKKRNFSKTSEPKGKEKSSKDQLLFVIQKHDASSLHYDLRLEMQSVLKSWAVPKGPSLNPADKRLAMMVEDHPFDYKDFEGIIPEGNYGAGTVIVWDEGTYKPMDTDGLTKKEQEKLLLQQLRKGDLKITFNGSKIKGSYALVKIGKDDEGNSWLLIKKNDKFSKETDVTKKDKSIKSGKTLIQVAKENGTVVKHPPEKASSKTATKKATAKKATAIKKTTSSKANKTTTKTKAATSKKKAQEITHLIKEVEDSAVKAHIPRGIKPMLAVLTNESFDDEEWIFEIKWDGYRSLAFVEDGEVELLSRNNNSFTDRYNTVADALKQLDFNAVFDGEIVAVDEKGMANFQMLQNWQKAPGAALQYYIFDIIWLNGYDLTKLPLIERKKILKQLLPSDNDVIKFSDHIEAKGKDFFDVAVKQGLEGIIAKHSKSFYQVNNRSNDWLKIKGNLRQEVVIAGFTQPRNSRKHFGALMLGVYKNNKLVYVGHTGSGFTQKSLDEIYKKLEPLITSKSPFEKPVKGNMPVTWVKPHLVCEIKFTEWTTDKIARHPIFMGLREDKKAKDVTLEKETELSVAKNDKILSAVPKKTASPKKASKKAASKKKTIASKNLQQLTLADGKDQSIVLNKIELKLTNLNKPYWKKEKYNKIDLVNYYLRMAPFIMPYILHRPHSLNRHPNGIAAANFYQKNMAGKQPDWIVTHEDFSESTNKVVKYLVCENEATLIYMANLGCIEINPWHSQTKTWKYPDWSLLDIDPDDTNTFDEVIEVTQVTKKVLDAIGVKACVKTSGSSGIHIYIPLGAKYDYSQSKQLAELIMAMVHQQLPELTSMERSPAKRKGKIYLDYLQNREIQTAAAPYSLRPKPGAPVSAPLHWDEVKKGLHPSQFHINNIYERVQAEGDLFKPVLGKGIDLNKVLKNLQSL